MKTATWTSLAVYILCEWPQLSSWCPGFVECEGGSIIEIVANVFSVTVSSSNAACQPHEGLRTYYRALRVVRGRPKTRAVLITTHATPPRRLQVKTPGQDSRDSFLVPKTDERQYVLSRMLSERVANLPSQASNTAMHFPPTEITDSLKNENLLSMLSFTRHDINNGTTEGPQELARLERGFQVFLGNQARLAGA